MTRRTALSLLLALALVPTTVWGGPSLRKEVVDNAVILHVPGAAGSGTLIDVNGERLVLTAAHVVDSCYTTETFSYLDGEGKEHVKTRVKVAGLEAVFRDGTRLKGKPVWSNQMWRVDGLDLALVKLDGDLSKRSVAATDFLSDRFEEGEDAAYCGYGAGVEFSLEKTIVNRFTDRYLTVNGIATWGHSGSGVYVKRMGAGGEWRWTLVGVVVQYAADPRRYPKAPCECEGPKSVRDFLKDYAEHAKEKGRARAK
jgi:hypothetical protein